MKINKAITAAIAFIVALPVVFFLVVPAYEESAALRNTIAQKERDYLNKKTYYEGIIKEFDNIEARRETLAKVESALPSQVTFAPLVSFLQQKGVESGLAVKSLAFLDVSSLYLAKGSGVRNTQSALAKDSSKVKNISFNIELIGTYQGLKSFLASLENSARLFQIDTIGFGTQKTLESVAGAKSQLQIYTFSLQAKTHTY